MRVPVSLAAGPDPPSDRAGVLSHTTESAQDWPLLARDQPRNRAGLMQPFPSQPGLHAAHPALSAASAVRTACKGSAARPTT